MKIYRHRHDLHLYTIELVCPMMYTGSWFEARQYPTGAVIRKNVRLTDFVVIAER